MKLNPSIKGEGPYLDIHKEGEVTPDSTNTDKWREGVNIFADVLNGSPLS